jgi:hypothetical protein
MRNNKIDLNNTFWAKIGSFVILNLNSDIGTNAIKNKVDIGLKPPNVYTVS